MVEESKSMNVSDDDDDDDEVVVDVQPVVVVPQPPSCYIDRVPDDLWKRLALILACRDAAALYATGRAVRTSLTTNKWSPRLTRAAERATLVAVAATNDSWRQLGWGSSTGVVRSPGVLDDASGR